VVAALALAACGDDDDAGSAATTAAGATAAAAATSGAYLVPHSGQASVASSQHHRQANTSQAGQWQSPTHGPIAATSTDVPQRSQKGSGAPPGSRAPCLAGLRAASFRWGSITSDKDRWPDDRRSLPTDGPTLARPSADKSRGRLPKEPASKLSR